MQKSDTVYIIDKDQDGKCHFPGLCTVVAITHQQKSILLGSGLTTEYISSLTSSLFFNENASNQAQIHLHCMMGKL